MTPLLNAAIPIAIKYGVPLIMSLGGYIGGRIHGKKKAAEAALASAVASVQPQGGSK